MVCGRSRRLKPVIVDPGLYLVEKTDMFFASQKRELPKAFKLFSGMLIFTKPQSLTLCFLHFLLFLPNLSPLVQ